MIVEDKFGSLQVQEANDNDAANDAPQVGDSFDLFGRHQVSPAEALADGVDLFAARVAAFDSAMQSNYEHILLKDLVAHINNNN